MKPKTSEQIAAAARDGAGIDAAAKRAVAKELDMRRKLGLPIVTTDSLEARQQQSPRRNGTDASGHA